MGMMNIFYKEELGRAIGEVIELDDGIGWGPYLKVKVWMNISNPILKGKLINFAGTQKWLTFRYERLPNFCFKCGVIKHPRGLVNSKLQETEPT